MHAKWTLPLAGAWLITVASAYFIGNSQNDSQHSEGSDTATSSSKGFQRSSGSISGSMDNGSRSTPKLSKSSSGASRTQAFSDIASISKISDPLARSRRMLDFIEGLTADQFEGVMEDFRATGMTRERRNEYAMLLRAWGNVDPLAALAYTTSNPTTGRGGDRRGGRGDYASQEVLAAWATNNPNAALNWARENHEGDDANPYLVGVVKGLVGSDQTLATQVLQEIPYSEERGEALRELIPYVAQNGTEAASSWLNSIEDERLVNGAADSLASHLSRQDPATAGQWVLTLPEGEARRRAIDEVMETWARRDIEAASTWMNSLSPEDQSSAGPEFVNTLARQDAVAAADWVDTQIDSSNYQRLLREFAEGAASSDPVLALNYGNELQSEEDRSRTVGRALWSLYRQDKESARSWIQNNPLPERIARHADKMLED